MIRPTQAELSVLSRTERFGYLLADFLARRAAFLSIGWNSTVMVATTCLLIRRRVRVVGIEHVRALDPARGTVLLANHRSFFDFFAVECALFRDTSLSRRLLFPVRANFFYDHPLGIAVNLLMSGMTMFPPIERDPRKHAFNRYATRRCAAELEWNRVVLGLHPEGTRSHDPDPYQLRAGKLGTGEMLLAAPSAQIVPVFITGLSNRLDLELYRNWMRPAAHPIYIGFGPPVELGELYCKPEERRCQREAVVRAMAAIGGVGERVRQAIRNAGSGTASRRDGAGRERA
jgi:1-acyl-sn-glycerol-3-phosphate acyltransferase